MAEVKSIGEFYDPTKTLNAYVGMQHVALQNQQLQQQQANMEIDNLKQAAQMAVTENPSQAAGPWNAYMGAVGGPQVKDSNAFVANPKPFWDQLNFPPGSQEWKDATAAIDNMGVTTRKRSEAEFNRQGMLQGAGELITQAGGEATPGMKSFMAQSEQGQRQVTEAIFDPSKQAVAEMNKEHMAQKAGINAELHPLLDLGVDSGRALKEMATLTPQIAAIQAQYEKDKPTLGITKAAGKRQDAVLGNPDLTAYRTRAAESVPKIEQALAQVKQEIDQATKDAHHLFAGTKPQTTDDSVHITRGTMSALNLKEQYLQSVLALAKDPLNPTKHQAVEQLAKTIDARAGELYQSRTALDVRRDAAAETARKNAAAEAIVSNIGKAQVAWMEAGGKPTDAYKFAKQFGVKVEEVTEAGKDWNRPTAVTNVNTFAPASVEAQRDYMKGARTTYDQLKQAQPLLDNIEKAKSLIPSAKGFMGPGGETLLEAAKFLNNRLGASINTAGIKSAEELRSRIFFNIMDNLKKMDAQPSQMQQQIMQESLGKLGTDPNALTSVLDAYGDVVRGKVEQYNEDVAGAEQRGIKFPYDPKIRLKDRGKISAQEPPSTMTPGVPQFHDPEKQKRYEDWKKKHKP